MRTPYVSVCAMPRPGQTIARVQPERETTYGWTTQQHLDAITTLVVGGLTVQFDTPADALAWLAECGELLAAEMVPA